MTYKEKLVMFVKLKRAHIKKFGFVYTDHKDYDNIRSWTEENCKKIYRDIVESITRYKESRGLSNLTCPWCIYHENEKGDPCSSCSYGKRHGQCDDKNSLYRKYATREVKDSFTNEVYRDMINKIDKQ